MRAVVLDGRRDEGKREFLSLLRDAVADSGGGVEVFSLREMTIAPCIGCFGCWLRTPGECVIDDDARRVARSVARSDVVFFVTPVTFGGYSSVLKKALDRMIPNISPFFARYRGDTHHRRRYPRPPALAGLGFLPHEDREAERIFKTLVERNALNLQSPRVAAAVVVAGREMELRETVCGLVKAVAG